MADDNFDTDLDLLAEEVHCMINQRNINHEQRARLFLMLLADIVGSVDRAEYRRLTARNIKTALPHYLD